MKYGLLLGAALTINYRQQPDWENAVLEATEGKGVDVTVEVGGAGTLPRTTGGRRGGGVR